MQIDLGGYFQDFQQNTNKKRRSRFRLSLKLMEDSVGLYGAPRASRCVRHVTLCVIARYFPPSP